MFVRYLGGGIGHLEQFPPADNTNEDTPAGDGTDVEAEMDGFIATNNTEDNNNDCGEGKEVGESEDPEDDDDREEEEETEEEDDDDDLFDEEIGNVY